MLKERIKGRWLRYRLTREDPEGTFYCVVANYSAFSHQKMAMLNSVVESNPDLKDKLSDETLLRCFKRLADGCVAGNEILSPAELEWVSVYVQKPVVRTTMEMIIYRALLQASAHWDKMRHAYNWSLTERGRKELAQEVLNSTSVSSKRKYQLAQEFCLPDEEFARKYFRRLAWDRHYDKAEGLNLLGSVVEEAVIDVIVGNLESGHVRDAVEVAERFLSHRQDVIQELKEIQMALK